MTRSAWRPPEVIATTGCVRSRRRPGTGTTAIPTPPPTPSIWAPHTTPSRRADRKVLAGACQTGRNQEPRGRHRMGDDPNEPTPASTGDDRVDAIITRLDGTDGMDLADRARVF